MTTQSVLFAYLRLLSIPLFQVQNQGFLQLNGIKWDVLILLILKQLTNLFSKPFITFFLIILNPNLLHVYNECGFELPSKTPLEKVDIITVCLFFLLYYILLYILEHIILLILTITLTPSPFLTPCLTAIHHHHSGSN